MDSGDARPGACEPASFQSASDSINVQAMNQSVRTACDSFPKAHPPTTGIEPGPGKAQAKFYRLDRREGMRLGRAADLQAARQGERAVVGDDGEGGGLRWGRGQICILPAAATLAGLLAVSLPGTCAPSRQDASSSAQLAHSPFKQEHSEPPSRQPASRLRCCEAG